jgi:hypothetical protein
MRAADDTRPTEPADLLDAWLADPAVRTHHRRTAASAPADLWRAATHLRLSETRTLGHLIRWRIPGLASGDLTYGELFRAYPFTVLEEGDGYLLAGLCGRIWTLARDYPRLDGPDAFATWREPGTVRVLFGHWVRRDGDGAELVSEARVQPVDRSASLRLRALWKLIGPFERLVGAEAITVAVRGTESRADKPARRNPS